MCVGDTAAHKQRDSKGKTMGKNITNKLENKIKKRTLIVYDFIENEKKKKTKTKPKKYSKNQKEKEIFKFNTNYKTAAETSGQQQKSDRAEEIF